ncbi:MAG: S8 family serine peptidase, partial [Pseudomonadota bacterium]
ALVEAVGEIEAVVETSEDDEADEERSWVVNVAPTLANDLERSQLAPFQLPVANPTAVLEAPISNLGAGVPTALTAPVLKSNGINAPTLSGIVTPQSIDPFYGDIDPFYGDINPFYGDIDAFWGNINPFYGDINPFYGDIDAFWGDINPFYGDINPFYGDIDAFWGDIDAFYGDITAFNADDLKALGQYGEQASAKVAAAEATWSKLIYSFNSSGAVTISYNGEPNRIRAALNNMIAHAEAEFGAAYTAETGKSFQDGFVAELLERHNISLGGARADKETLAKSAAERAAFYLDFNDSLLQYSGIDQVDHWMAAINWTPSVTQIQGNGADTIIGIIDGSFTNDTDLSNNIVWAGGGTSSVGGHGAGVASLIAGAHDGQGILGIAPDVNIATYNPFGHDHTSSWDSVAEGIVSLQPNGLQNANQFGRTSIINMSLGESDWTLSQGLADLFARQDIAPITDDTVFVVAAGNDGIVQSADIDWDYDVDATLILVGSINPLGEISNFSNQTGDTCLLDNGVCRAGNELYNRYIVAPGELLLVSDGQGGVTRHSGTSFAAPLVSGAISLLHDRWEWLAEHPEATAEIIFRSARDLGAPGVDEVYGHGLLDVTASQSPLDFNKLTFRLYQRVNGRFTNRNVSVSDLMGAIPDWWETDDVFFTAYEQVGDTERDFSIPVSTFNYNRTTSALGRGHERFQDFVTRRFTRWINSGGNEASGNGLPGFTEAKTHANELNGEWSLRYAAMAPTLNNDGSWNPTHSAATLTNPNGKFSFTVGHGQGAMALGNYRFGVMSDHDPFTGGVNPVLGFASGETFLAAGYKLAPNTTVKVGYTENREDWTDFAGSDQSQLQVRQQLGDRPAHAFTLDIEQQVSEKFSVGLNVTKLREVNALLGTQSSTSALLGNGASTEAMTVSASFDAGNGFSFDVSATGAKSETAQDQLFTNAGSVWSTAAQFTATKRGILGANDTLRVSVAQPLQVEEGSLQFVSEEVIDRATGETGSVTQTFGIETQRRITTEAVYALPLTQSSEFGVFSRYVSAGDTADEAGFVVGGNFSIRF